VFRASATIVGANIMGKANAAKASLSITMKWISQSPAAPSASPLPVMSWLGTRRATENTQRHQASTTATSQL